jgi:DNA modification methylase
MMAEKVTIGNCELWHGDCREVLPLLPPVDLVLTDPPYGIKRDRGMGGGGFDSTGKYRRKARTYEGGWDDEAPAADLLEMVIASAKAAIVWGGNYMPLGIGGKWLVWNKEQVMPSYSDAELAWTNLTGESVKLYTLHCNRARLEAGHHPTQKPLALMEWCIQHAPNPATVCDPFMGSGTTGVACARMGLQFVGIERERKYFDIACRRIEQAYAQPRLFEDAKVDAGDTAVQGDMLLPANAK